MMDDNINKKKKNTIKWSWEAEGGGIQWQEDEEEDGDKGEGEEGETGFHPVWYTVLPECRTIRVGLQYIRLTKKPFLSAS